MKILDFGMARSEREDARDHIDRGGHGHPGVTWLRSKLAVNRLAPAQICSASAASCTASVPAVCPSRVTRSCAVLTSISTETPPAPRDLNDRIPGSLSVLIMRLLHKMPEARPVSAEVVLKELRSIERELLAERQNAESSEAASRMDVAGHKSQSAGEVVVETSPPQPASGPQARLGTARTRGRTGGARGHGARGLHFGPDSQERRRDHRGRTHVGPGP